MTPGFTRPPSLRDVLPPQPNPDFRLPPASRKVYWPLLSNVIRRRLPNHTYGRVRDGNTTIHQGWDLEAAVGTACFAVGNGTVVDVNRTDVGGYGRWVCMSFPGQGKSYIPKTYYAFYAHLESVYVNAGDGVTPYTILGLTGKSGNARNFGPADHHLHFEIRTSGARLGTGLEGRINPEEIYGITPLNCPILRYGGQACWGLWPSGVHVH